MASETPPPAPAKLSEEAKSFGGSKAGAEADTAGTVRITTWNGMFLPVVTLIFSKSARLWLVGGGTKASYLIFANNMISRCMQ